MNEYVVAGLMVVCWLNGVWFGWLRWRLPQLKYKQGETK